MSLVRLEGVLLRPVLFVPSNIMDYDFKGMTVDELKQLKELTQQSLDYYKNILEDNTLQDGDKVAFQLCYDMMQSDMDEINDELELRK